ncbi:MAG: hypothetical protein IJ778_04655 [Alphaproteobacteria bacterium]|nr:hypothetical protein [Alphaproteobacteria bacterium]
MNCAQDYECVWDGSAAPYTQGHCKPWTGEEDTKKAYVSDDLTSCGGKGQSPKSLCCVVQNDSYGTQLHCVATYGECLSADDSSAFK